MAVKPVVNKIQKKRAYRKSTLGCCNCKLRRVKCDETKPSCQKCRNYGVSCDYQSKGAELHAYAEAVDEPSTSLGYSCSLNQTMLDLINSSLRASYALYEERNSVFELSMVDLERLNRFQTRTVVAMSVTATRAMYQNGIIRLISQHPYLMHVVMTLTAMHDRYLGSSKYTRISTLECFHWSRAASMFKQKLDTELGEEDKDAVWAACALLKGICLGAVDATCPDDSWPLNADGPTPLDWIKLQEGVSAIWHKVYPLKPDSLFNTLATAIVLRQVEPKPWFFGVDGIPPKFIELYDLDDFSDTHSSPYFEAVHSICSLMKVDCNADTLLHFFHFTSNMDPEFKSLMTKRDPRALLLVAYWYAMMNHVVWHITWRATIECQSICIYLERYHAYNKILQELLDFPKSKCGLDEAEPNTPPKLPSVPRECVIAPV